MNELADLNFPVEYFFDEVREGFFVSSMMKRYWAAQIKVLAEIDRICRKHGLKWYAYCGTLLGAVRHGGYIPWDDDLDVCMLRDDYEKFTKAVHDELSEGYLYLDVRCNPEYELLLGRVVNSRVINFDKKHLEEWFGCPYTIGIDVFPLDGMFRDQEKEEKRFALECKVMRVGELIRSGQINSDECKGLLREIEMEKGIRFDRHGNMIRQILLLLDELFAMCPSTDAEFVTLSPACIKDGKQNHKYPKEWFDVQVKLPFENTFVSAPVRYDDALTRQYGKYMVIRKGTGIHDYPVFKDQEEILAEHFGHKPFRYTFSAKELQESLNFSRNSRKDHYDQVIDTIREAHGQIERFVEAGNDAAALQLLEGCQNLAVSIGTDIEGVFGEGTGAVKTLEDYCEKIFEFSQGAVSDIEELDEAVNMAKDNIDELISGAKRKVLFIVSHFEWWRSIEEIWRWASLNKEQDVKVLVAPYYKKDLDGNRIEKVDDSERFRGIVPFVTEENYDVTVQQPDVIVIQDPYDGWDREFSLEEKYYSKNLRRLCRELTLVPFVVVDNPANDKDTIYAALEYIAEQPGFIHADKVLIQFEKVRDIYREWWVQLSGEVYRDYWKNKFVDVTSETVSWLPAGRPGKTQTRRYLPWNVVYPAPVIDLLGDYSKKKIMIYYTSLDYVLKNGQKAIDKIIRSFMIMEKACAEDSITCVFSPQVALKALLQIKPELYEQLEKALDEFNSSEGCFYDENGVMQEYITYADAYYGVESYLHKKCVREGIPVMIENLEV